MDKDQGIERKTGAAGPAAPAPPSGATSDRQLVAQNGLGASTAVPGQHPVGRRAKRRTSRLSEIDAEIRTVEGNFANVIYLATEQ